MLWQFERNRDFLLSGLNKNMFDNFRFGIIFHAVDSEV